MTNRELLQLITDLHTPEPDHDPAGWDGLLAEADQGRAHE